MSTIAKLQVLIAGDASSMNRSMRQAAGAVKGLQQTVSTGVGKINGMLGTLGIGLTAAGLTNLAKGAIEDAKSFAVMSNAIKNATGATDEQVAAADAYIQTVSNQLGIMDDDLRPAMIDLTQATGDVATAQGLLTLAADIAADKNISLVQASKLVGKAYNGNTTALVKYYGSAKDAADPLAEVARLTKGAAEAASNTDPLAKITIIFENLTETIGSYLLPYLTAFSDWLNSPQGQDVLNALATAFENIFNTLFGIFKLIGDNSWLVGFIVSLITIVKVFFAMYAITKKVYSAMKGLTIAQMVAKAIQTMVGPAAIVAGIAALAAGIGMFVGLDLLFGDNTAVEIPSAPSAQQIAPPEIKPPDLSGRKKPKAPGGDKRKGFGKVDDSVKKAIETLKKSLAQIQALIAEFGKKFRESVTLAFGIIDRGASKFFRADRYIRELKRMRDALKDYQANLKKLRSLGGAAATPLINELLGMAPEEAAAAMRAFVANPAAFAEAIKTSNELGAMGRAVGRDVSQMMGNQTEEQMLAEIRLLRADLAKGKNTYNIKSTMTATQILDAIRKWEKSTGKRVLVG